MNTYKAEVTPLFFGKPDSMKFLVLCLVVLFIDNSVASPFPKEDWPLTPLENIEPIALKAFNQYVFPTRPFETHMGPRTEAVVIVKDGKIVFEKYSRNYNKDRKHLLWSISKSYIHLLIGFAVEHLKFNPSESICIKNPHIHREHCKLNYDQIAQWASGLKWLEEYEKAEDPRQSSVLSMLYGEGQLNSGEFISKHAFAGEPGKTWRYSSGDTNYISHLMRGVFKGTTPREIINQKIFKPLNIKNATIEEDASGNLLLASNVYMTARELARLGLLFMNKGNWNGQQLLSKQWIEDSLKVVPSHFEAGDRQSKNYISGRHFWLNSADKKLKYPNPWPEAPLDTFASFGHWGQLMFMIPSKNIVVVRFGDTREKKFFDKQTFLKLSLGLIEAKSQ